MNVGEILYLSVNIYQQNMIKLSSSQKSIRNPSQKSINKEIHSWTKVLALLKFCKFQSSRTPSIFIGQLPALHQSKAHFLNYQLRGHAIKHLYKCEHYLQKSIFRLFLISVFFILKLLHQTGDFIMNVEPMF